MRMTLEGEVAELYETWPLQLSLKTSAGQYLVALSERTKVFRKGRPIPATGLKPGMKLTVEGSLSGSKAIAAQSIGVQ
jgi:hypothetical protein